ncbi:MAG: TIGR01777 family oxidoreductase [Desulfovibrionaceae bacterium]
MRTVIIGGTGFIGQALARLLHDSGHQVVVPARDPGRCGRMLPHGAVCVPWEPATPHARWVALTDGADALVNLAGEGIAARRWTPEQKQRILGSRLDAGGAATEAVRLVAHKPRVLIQASAIGYYGDRGDAMLDETAAPGTGFLADTAQAWEASTASVEAMGVRRAVIRTGVVLGAGGGALANFLTPFRLFAGGPLGPGTQWMSWIHLHDQCAAIAHLIHAPGASGVFNLTAPEPVTMRGFCKELGAALRRPSWLPAPAFALRLALGEMADELILASQRVVPARLRASGFTFTYPGLAQALRQAVGRQRDAA